MPNTANNVYNNNIYNNSWFYPGFFPFASWEENYENWLYEQVYFALIAADHAGTL